MDAAHLLRLVAAGFVILAIALTGLELRRPPPPGPPAIWLAPTRPAADPAEPELARCQALGEAGARDAGCLAAWAGSRRRFLGLPSNLTTE